MTITRWVCLLVLCSLATEVRGQTCPTGNPRVAPTSRYSISEPVSGESVVTDLATGLMWKRCTEGHSGADCSTGTLTSLTWSSALNLANAATDAGFSDWRLPNADELLSLVETGCANPAINATVFPRSVSSWYWSSTTALSSSPTSPSRAWGVSFQFGQTSELGKSGFASVRLVRGGQWLDPFAAEGDAAPDTFSLTAQTGVPLSRLRTSDLITISGLTSVTGIGVTGAAGSSYSINGGTFSNLPGAVTNGDQVRVRHTSAAVLNTPATTTLSIGGVSANFVTTTLTGAAATITTITAINPPTSQVVGVPYTVSVSVTGSAPTGTVTVGDGGGNSCTITLPGTNCALSSTTVGAKTITATYAGDTGNAGSVDTESYSITASSGAPVGLQVGAVVLPATSASPTVTFPQAFRSVPVVILQASGEDADPQGLRIRNVTTTGFQLLQVEPPGCTGCNGSAGTHTVHWLAAAPGRYRLEQDSFAPAWLGSALRGSAPGALMIVGSVSTRATQYNSSLGGFSGWPAASWESVSWPTVGGGLDFSAAPMVLTTIQSWANEGANLTVGGLVGASQPWAQSVQQNVTAGGFQLALDASEVSADDTGSPGFDNAEVVGYVAVQAETSQALLPLSGPPGIGFVTGRALQSGALCNSVDLDFPIGSANDGANFRGFAGKQARAVSDGGWLRRCELRKLTGTRVRR